MQRNTSSDSTGSGTGGSTAVVAQPVWKPDDSVQDCESCHKPFSLFRRRHHCRSCGGIFCAGCSGKNMPLTKYGINEPVRVCDVCYAPSGEPQPQPQQAGGVSDFNLRGRKICILGACEVGKSAVTQQFVEDRFSATYNPTINHSYYKKVKVRGTEYMLSILDTAGQDETSLFQPNYAIGTHGYLVVYSVTERSSFELCPEIYEKIQSHAVDFVMVLVGNKVDLENNREVSVSEGAALAEQWKCPFIECSAKKKDQVNKVFMTLLEMIIQHEEGPPKVTNGPPGKKGGR